MITKIKKLLNECFFLEGDFLDTRVFNADKFMHLIAAAKNQNKIAYGLDTWNGLEAPTKKDLCTSNYFIYNKGAFLVDKDSVSRKLKKEMSEFTNYKLINSLNEMKDNKFSFVLLDKIFYEPTKNILDVLWDKIAYGGTIFIPNYMALDFSSDLAIKQFIEKYNKDIIINKQLIIDEIKENFLIIKCFNEKNKPTNWDKISKSNKKDLVVAMVYKSGGAYTAEYVNALANGIRRNTNKKDLEIACITNDSRGFNDNINTIIPFKHDYKHWWGKIELFRSDLFENKRVFYIDLDTVIVDNIDEILDFDFDFIGLRDFYKMTSLGSGLMSWNCNDVQKIYNNFLEKSSHIMSNYLEGDQQWIDQNKPKTIYFQDLFPKEIISFKVHCLKSDKSISIPKGAKIICFHGTPKPHEIQNPLIKDHWKPE